MLCVFIAYYNLIIVYGNKTFWLDRINNMTFYQYPLQCVVNKIMFLIGIVNFIAINSVFNDYSNITNDIKILIYKFLMTKCDYV